MAKGKGLCRNTSCENTAVMCAASFDAKTNFYFAHLKSVIAFDSWKSNESDIAFRECFFAIPMTIVQSTRVHWL